MLKRDSLTAQMQQLSHVLAKVKRLVLEDREADAANEVYAVLKDYYELSHNDILWNSQDEFSNYLLKKVSHAEELSYLARFLDELAGTLDDEQQRRAIWEKVILLLDLLEEQYHTISFEHISRKQILKQGLIR